MNGRATLERSSLPAKRPVAHHLDGRRLPVGPEARCLDVKGGSAGLCGLDPPQVDLHLDARFRAARMRMALIAGVRPGDNPWRWSAVARDGTPTGEFLAARLYAFTKTGCRVCVFDAKRLKETLNCGEGWIDFVWRVLVEGPWERPEAVTPVWIIEGHDHPIQVRYFFQ
jgi:hypothetical protein